MSVGDKKLRNHRLILTEDNASLLPLDCLEHRVTDPGFRIQFQLVHRVLVDGPTIIISSYWDKIARLYLVNTCDLNGLVMCLETFTGKKCQVSQPILLRFQIELMFSLAFLDVGNIRQ